MHLDGRGIREYEAAELRAARATCPKTMERHAINSFWTNR